MIHHFVRAVFSSMPIVGERYYQVDGNPWRRHVEITETLGKWVRFSEVAGTWGQEMSKIDFLTMYKKLPND